jgi:hypothetical protein
VAEVEAGQASEAETFREERCCGLKIQAERQIDRPRHIASAKAKQGSGFSYATLALASVHAFSARLKKESSHHDWQASQAIQSKAFPIPPNVFLVFTHRSTSIRIPQLVPSIFRASLLRSNTSLLWSFVLATW